ncbi:cytochrome P450 [Lipomyces arxii]|uniref:cytochrome P450 n=1 Tax=Lipomyces arxii TaxID=56418 RepID=UPI0034CDAFEE
MQLIGNFVAAVWLLLSVLILKSGFVYSTKTWLAVIIVPVLVRVIYSYWLYNLYFSPYRDLPTPYDKPHWFFGHTEYVQNEQPGMAQRRWLEQLHGKSPFFKMYGVFGKERLVANSHAALQAVFMTHSYDFVKSNITRKALALLIGDGLLNTEGEYHKRQRRQLSPSFSFGHIKSLTPIFIKNARALSDHLAKLVPATGNTIINIDEPVHATTLDVIFQAGFGIESDALNNQDDEIVVAYRNSFLFDRITLPMKIDRVIGIALQRPTVLPIKRNRDMTHGRKIIYDYVLNLLHQKEQQMQESGDKSNSDRNIMSTILTNGRENWTQAEIVNNLMTFLAAGHETTLTATVLALHELSKHPEVQTKLRKEILSLIPEYSADSSALDLLTYDNVESLKYLSNVSRELLRFHSPVPNTSRVATKDILINGVLVKKGTLVLCPIGGINRLSAYWGDDSNLFNPDRWDSLPPEAASPYSFFTFLQGPRSCIGRKFAEIEFKCLLIALVGRYEFAEQEPGKDLRRISVVTQKFANGLPIKIGCASH